MGHSPEQIHARLHELGRAFGIDLDLAGQLRRLPGPLGTQTTASPGHTAPTASPASASAEESFRWGEECRAREQWDQAISFFGASISLNPNFAIAYFKRGNIHLRMGRCDEA